MNYDPEGPTSAKKSFRVGRWSVDPAACELRDGDTVIRLRPKVMDLLAAFARNPGEVLSKHCLLDLVWSDVTVGDASLTVAVGELRDALGDQPGAARVHRDHPAPRLPAHRTGLGQTRSIDVSAEASRFWLDRRRSRTRAPAGHQPHRPGARRRDPHRVAQGLAPPRPDHRRWRHRGGRRPRQQERHLCRRRRITAPTPLDHGDQLRLGQLAALLRIVIADHESTVTELSQR